MMKLTHTPEDIMRQLKNAGLRPTRQRMMLAIMLAGKGHCHVTAEMLHAETKKSRHKVSLATIYNTLHQFTKAGLLREVAVENGRTYFDTNVSAHHHFLDEHTGSLHDIAADTVKVLGIPLPPKGTRIRAVDVVVRVTAD